MALTLAQRYLAFVNDNQQMKSRLQAALATAAARVIKESPATTKHAERLTWARGVLADQAALEAEAFRIFWYGLDHAVVGEQLAASTDAQLLAMIDDYVTQAT